MALLAPRQAMEVAAFLQDASAARKSLQIAGNGSKRLWGGPVSPADDTLSTTGLNRILEYEQNDLTVSVEAGIPLSQLQQILSKHGQMIALDPPYAESATVGGVIAANSSGTMRRRYGTARDLVIGMTFATTEGKLVSSGGRVVKNVAGLDMGKLLIGSFGTLAAVVSINLRVHSKPDEWWTFLYSFSDLSSALTRQREILQSPMRPAAMELLNPAAAARVGLSQYTLAVRAAGSRTVLKRYAQELNGSDGLIGPGEESLWKRIREFAPDYLKEQEGGIVVRAIASATEVGTLLRAESVPVVSRCGAGLSYLFCEGEKEYSAIVKGASGSSCRFVMEAGPQQAWRHLESPVSSKRTDAGFATMKGLKDLFDPNAVLNRARLYDRF